MSHIFDVTYDSSVDAMYIYLSDDSRPRSDYQIEVPGLDESEMYLDFSADGVLLGIEIIGAAVLVRPELLERAREIGVLDSGATP